MVLIILGALTFGFSLLVAYLYVNQRKMTYFPRPLDRSLAHVRAHQADEVRFEHGKIQLHGWLIRPEKERLIIYYGGNGEELSHSIDEFRRLEDFAVLLVNYRGYGESEGSPKESDLVGDALAIFDQVRARYETVVLMGRSLGSGIAVQVASQKNINRLVLITPYDSIRAIAQNLYPFIPVSWFLKDTFDSAKYAGRVSAPALFLVAEYDEVIPAENSRKLLEHWPSKTDWVQISGATHNTISGFPEYWRAIDEFLQLNP